MNPPRTPRIEFHGLDEIRLVGVRAFHMVSNANPVVLRIEMPQGTRIVDPAAGTNRAAIGELEVPCAQA